MAEYLQAASIKTLLVGFLDGYLYLLPDGTEGPMEDGLLYVPSECRAELLRRFTALEAERDEARSVISEALKYIMPVMDGNGPARTLLLSYLARTAQPPTAKEGDDE
jgi:hypothetical protein